MKSGWLIIIIILLSLLLGGVIIFHITNPHIVTIPNPVTTTPVQTGMPDTTYPAPKKDIELPEIAIKPNAIFPGWDSTYYDIKPQMETLCYIFGGISRDSLYILFSMSDTTVTIFNKFGEKKIFNLNEHFDEEISFRQQLISEKLFKWKVPFYNNIKDSMQIDSQVWVYTPCEPDSMGNQITVDQTKFQEALKMEVEKQRLQTKTWKTLAEITAAMGVGLGIGIIVSK